MINVAAILDALGEPSRRQIVAFLAEGEAGAGEIAGQFASTAGAVSQHLAALRRAGLVRVRAEGRRRIYALEAEALASAAAWLLVTAGLRSGRIEAVRDALRA